MNKQRLFLSIILIILIPLLSGCGNDSRESILDNSQKTLDELNSQKEQIVFSDTISLDQEKTITFRFRDYKDAPKNPQTTQETKDNLISLEGQIDIRILEKGEVQEIDSTHQADEGETLQYIIYEIRGRADNPDSLTIYPRRMDETGWDPAPQFVLIKDGENDYPSSYYTRALLKSKDYDASLGGPEFTDVDWQPHAAVVELLQGEEPVWAFKYIDLVGNSQFIQVK